MSQPDRKPIQFPESYRPQRPEILSMAENLQKVEKFIKAISYQGVDFEIVERSDVLWVGCVDYAGNNTDESDIGGTLKRYREELIDIVKEDLINPDWSASLSINYGCEDKPCGLMFAQETYTDIQDERYDLLTQPGGLWLRIHATEETDAALLGRASNGLWEYFDLLAKAAEENGYRLNPDVQLAIEYHCHAEYSTPPHTCYAYIPVVR